MRLVSHAIPRSWFDRLAVVPLLTQRVNHAVAAARGFSWVLLSGYGVAAASLLLFIWRVRFLPSQDYPEWVYQGFLVGQVLAGSPVPGFSLVPAIPPNALATWLIGVLSLLVPVEAAGKLVISLYAVLFVVGIALIMRYIGGADSPLGLMTLVLLPGFFLWNGVVGYLLGLSILLIAIGLVARVEFAIQRLGWPLLSILALLLYLAHGLAWVAFAIIVGMCLLCRPTRRAFVVATIAFLPSLLLLLAYVIQQHGAGKAATTFPAFDSTVILDRLRHIAAILAPSHAFYPFFPDGPARWMMAILNVVAVVLLGTLALHGMRAGWQYRHRPMVMCATLFLGIAVIGPATISDLWNPGERLVIPAVVILVAIASSSLPVRAYGIPGLIVVGGLLSAQAVLLHRETTSTATLLASTYDNLASVDFRPLTVVVHEAFFQDDETIDRPLPPLFVPAHSPLNLLPYYRMIEDRATAQIAGTGVLRTSQPVIEFVSPRAIRGIYDLEQCPRQIVIIGNDPGVSVIAQQFQPVYAVALVRPRFILLRAEPEWCDEQEQLGR